ncbi:hypothetical protein POM88_038791 [Heracleum sosnowskyi]|uniref:Lysine-specific demethylase REF6 n=1 Tax=Heracleum sosnowskyi TaxID=360622 RepID=A0AAD8H969_9APIA|nr:hypothetical protein POM88_038791 [Heracleum sosnowskyi]
MARIRGRAGYKPKAFNRTEVFQWLKTLPVAPEFHPTLEEFQDLIAYISKIEKEASSYGICKIIPPVSLPSRKTTILELNKSFLACSGSREGELRPAFSTRVQQIGFCPRKDNHVIRSVRESGQSYTLSEFEAKAKAFEKNHFKNSSIVKGVLSPLELETLYWDAQADKAIEVEYGNDMPGSAFVELDKRRGGEGLSVNLNVGDTEWNVRGAARAEGCPLRFVKDDIPGVTSPMVYMGMMFSWFAWHVEDHDFHSLNYMHMGDAKTWYGVPSDAAIAFEEVIRNHGYEGQKNFISTYETLAQKTTVMSPEVILNAGIPCCRLVQNAGEFVVTFPRAYHSGFSHGFNCAEASNIATPEWLKFARKAAIRQASINFPPLVSHNQLLYNIALSSSSRVPMSVEPRSSGLKERKNGDDGEYLVKELFVQDVMHNTNLLHILGKGSPAILLPLDFIEGKFPRTRDGNTLPLSSKQLDLSCTTTSKKQKIIIEGKLPAQCERLANTEIFSCVTCGVLCFASAAIIRPSKVAAHNLMSADCGNVEGKAVASEVATRGANNSALDSSLGRIAARSRNYLSDVPASCSRPSKDTCSLSLLALTYGDATDSETESREVSPVYGLDSDDSTEVQNRGTLFPQHFDEDSSRSHVFCLQHAFEVELKLHALGGVHMLLLCHPDYPKFQAAAKRMADDLGADHTWSNIDFRTESEEDRESFKSSLNSEGSIPGNADWTVKLGVNLFYSAEELSHSQIDGKQIPYNSVLYKAFGHGSSADISAITKLDQKRSVVAGHWCGKDWMSNQIHHLLAEGVHDEQQVPEPDTMLENFSRSQTVDLSTETRKSSLKRKSMADVEGTSRAGESGKAADHAAKNKFIIVYERRKNLKEKVIQEETSQHKKDQGQSTEQSGLNSEEKPEGGPSTRLRPRTGKHVAVIDKVVTRSASKNLACTEKAIRSPGIQPSTVKRTKNSEKETEYVCKVESCTMKFGSKRELVQHTKNICSVEGCRKKFYSHKYLLQHRRVHLDDRPLQCPWRGCTKTFKWAWARTEHIRVHTGERPYTCGETGCGKAFRFVSDFSRHKRTTGHSGGSDLASLVAKGACQALHSPIFDCCTFHLLCDHYYEETDVSHPDFFSSAKLNGYIPPNKEVSGKRMRIDYFIVSDTLKDRLVACEMHGQGIEL